jgi:hypothetical protein
MIGTSPSIIVFPLSMIDGGDSRITGFTKIVLEVEGVSERRRNIPESGLVSWALLNGEHVSELLV